MLYRIAQRVNLQGGRLNERAIRAPAGARYEVIAMKRNGSFAALIFMLILGAGAVLAYATYRVSAGIEALVVIGCALILAIFISSGIQVADQWSRAVV